MMLDARVRTVEAIEWTVCVDARLSRRWAKVWSGLSLDSSSSTHFSCTVGSLRVLIQYLHTRYVMTEMRKTPPTTPPAIAPTLGLDFGDSTGLISVTSLRGTQTAFGHAWQLFGYMNSHCVTPFSQGGQPTCFDLSQSKHGSVTLLLAPVGADFRRSRVDEALRVVVEPVCVVEALFVAEVLVVVDIVTNGRDSGQDNQECDLEVEGSADQRDRQRWGAWTIRSRRSVDPRKGTGRNATAKPV